MTSQNIDEIITALWGTGTNSDQNITDALIAIAAAIRGLTENARSDHPSMAETFTGIEVAINKVGAAIRQVSGSIDNHAHAETRRSPNPQQSNSFGGLDKLL